MTDRFVFGYESRMKALDEEVFLTGLPSLAARKTCEALLAAPSQNVVHALVREKDEEAFSSFLEDLPAGSRERIHRLVGEPSAIDLGLSGAEWQSVRARIQRIHHVAGTSQLGMSREQAQTEHVAAAREVLELARHCPRLRCLVHHSSASVSGTRTGLVLEDELVMGQSFRNVVEEAQAHAENLVLRARSRLPIVVLRPTLIAGDSRTGELDRFEGPHFLMLLMVTSPPDFALPLLGRGDLPLHLVPADNVTRVAALIGSDSRAIGKTFHIKDPSPPTARRVFELVAEAGGRRAPRGHIPANITKALLRAPGLDRIAQSPRAFLDALLTPVEYSAANTDALLAGSDVHCPPFESYVERLVEGIQTKLREKRDRRTSDAPETLA